jgi:hypothetical protein
MDINELKSLTKEFFRRHLYKENGKITAPQWSDYWTFDGQLHNNATHGCYAFLKGDEVYYIGMALNKGLVGYEKHSLGSRISNYWRVNKELSKMLGTRKYKPTDNLHQNGITSIITLPFENSGQEYLIPALEVYLITEMKPVMNVRYK